MRNFFNLHRFGYSVILHVDVASLIPYLTKLYEESVIDEPAASDCVYMAINDIPVSYRVRVYNNRESRDFRTDCEIHANWYHSMVQSMMEVIDTMGDNDYIFFADDMDELVQMVNDIVDHCKEMGFRGEVSEITCTPAPLTGVIEPFKNRQHTTNKRKRVFEYVYGVENVSRIHSRPCN